MLGLQCCSIAGQADGTIRMKEDYVEQNFFLERWLTPVNFFYSRIHFFSSFNLGQVFETQYGLNSGVTNCLVKTKNFSKPNNLQTTTKSM